MKRKLGALVVMGLLLGAPLLSYASQAYAANFTLMSVSAE